MSSATRTAVASASAVVAGVLAIALVVVLTAWAATSTRPLLAGRPAASRTVSVSAPPVPTRTATPTPTPTPTATPGSSLQGPPTWVWLALLGLLALLLVGAVVVALVRRTPWARDETVTAQEPSAPAGRPVTGDTVERARAALAGGSARNGIVACWAHLEDAAAAAGIERAATDTAADLARALARAGVPEAPLTDLARRYETARFSRADVDEAERERAAADLDALRRALDAGLPRPGAARATDRATDRAADRAADRPGAPR